MAKVKTHFRLTPSGELSILTKHNDLQQVCVLRISGQHDLQAARQLNIELTELKVIEPHQNVTIWGIIGEKSALEQTCSRINARAGEITKAERRTRGSTRSTKDPRYQYC